MQILPKVSWDIEMCKEIVAYNVITGMDVDTLILLVAESIKRGWVPQGGVALGQGGFPIQAVVKYKSPNQS